MNPPVLKSNTSGPENNAYTFVWRAVASNELERNPNGLSGVRKNGTPGATGACVEYRKSATTAPPRMSLKSPSPVLTVICSPTTSIGLPSTVVAGAFSTGGGAGDGAGFGAGPVAGADLGDGPVSGTGRA